MPPKCKFSNEDIIDAAFSVLRKTGWKTVSARTIAKVLKSSTTPIYTYLKSMKFLEAELVEKGFDLLQSYQTRVNTGDILIDLGVGHIMFARDEKNLFRFLNDEKHMAMKIKHGINIFQSKIDMLSDYPLAKDFTEEQKQKYLFAGWVFIHGLADLINKSFDAHIKMFTNEKEITEFLYEAFISIWDGMKNMVPELKTSPFFKMSKNAG